jgi:hypothetical protein
MWPENILRSASVTGFALCLRIVLRHSHRLVGPGCHGCRTLGAEAPLLRSMNGDLARPLRSLTAEGHLVESLVVMRIYSEGGR